MKKLGSFLLILLAMVHLAGVMPIALYMMQEVKNEAQVKLADNTRLTRVVVRGNEYNDKKIFQLRDEDEFMYRGNLYDFKSMSREGDKYIFYALEDTKETSLVSFLGCIFDQLHDQYNNAKIPFANLIKTLEKDFIDSALVFPLTTLTEKYFSLLPFTSGLLNCHTNVIFHPPA